MPPADGRSTAGMVNPADHGFGPVELSLPGLPTELDSRMIDTAKQSNGLFPFNLDLQSGNAVGVSKYTNAHRMTYDNGYFQAYLKTLLVMERVVVLPQHILGPF